MRRTVVAALLVLIGLIAILQAAFADGQDFLPVDQAFPVTAQRIDAQHIAVRWQIADAYYLYRHGFAFKMADARMASGTSPGLGAAKIPAGDRHDDPYFGAVETYRHDVRIVLPIVSPSSEQATAADSALDIAVSFQGCADAGLCYPPQTVTLHVPASQAVTRQPATSVSAVPDTSGVKTTRQTDAPPQDQLASRLAGNSPLLTLGLFLLLGVGLAFTPCILPMVPIVSAIVIGGDRAAASRSRAFGLSLAYVLAMATAYTVFGVIAGYFGANLQAWLQKPIVLLPFAALFALLAAGCFGWLALELPTGWHNRTGGNRTTRSQATSLWGAAGMGFLAALIAGPCLAPPLAGALLFIAASGNVWLGGGALFMLGLGMGLPLIAIAVFGDALLPRRGAWMNEIRVASGVVLLAVGLWLVSRLASPAAVLAGTGLLCLAYGAYISTRVAAQPSAMVIRRVAMTLLYGYAVLAGVGLAIGQGRPSAPLAGLLTLADSPASPHSAATPLAATHVFKRVTNAGELDAALAQARADGQPAIVDFYADWCVECVQMERTVFSQPAVRRALEPFAAIQVDVTDYNAQARKIMRKTGVFGPPTMLFYDAQGQPLDQARLIGATDADNFLAHLHRVESTADVAAH